MAQTTGAVPSGSYCLKRRVMARWKSSDGHSRFKGARILSKPLLMDGAVAGRWPRM
jgi:hypothetical protein